MKKASFFCLFTFVSLVVITLPTRPAYAQWVQNGNNINNTNTGFVGIGRSPLSKLDVYDAASNTALMFTPNGNNTELSFARGVEAFSRIKDTGGNFIFAPSSIDTVWVQPNRIGIGRFPLPYPYTTLDIYDAASNTAIMVTPNGNNTELSWGRGVEAFSRIKDTGNNLILSPASVDMMYLYTTGVCIGTPTVDNGSKLTVNGKVTMNGNLVIKNSGTTVVELGAGLDYAEGFNASDSKAAKPGTVMVIDPDQLGKLKISNTSYDRKIAGIVAGAKNLGSGVRLGTGQFDANIALAGRVYCNVDATREAITPGDLLTTSAIPGFAMKVTDFSRAQGAVLGKAMERLSKGKKGQILVLVTLQ